VQTPKNGLSPAVNQPQEQLARAPRWVRLTGSLAALLFVFVAAMVLGLAGPHGPTRHLPQSMIATNTDWRFFALLLMLFLTTLTLNGERLSRFRIVSVPASAFLRMTESVAEITPQFTMSSSLRKWVLVAHVATSVGAAGAVAAFLALSITGSVTMNSWLARACFVANAVIAQYVILPLVVSAIAIGMLQALTTPWGLIRHYWILVKLYMTIAIWLVLLIQLKNISDLAAALLAGNDAIQGIESLKQSLLIHAVAGLASLVAIVAISVVKPRGLTAYGRFHLV
jgi:hypothetical protein